MCPCGGGQPFLATSVCDTARRIIWILLLLLLCFGSVLRALLGKLHDLVIDRRSTDGFGSIASRPITGGNGIKAVGLIPLPVALALDTRALKHVNRGYGLAWGWTLDRRCCRLEAGPLVIRVDGPPTAARREAAANKGPHCRQANRVG